MARDSEPFFMYILAIWPSSFEIILLWQYSQRRNQATLGGVENSDFNFQLAGPRRIPVSEP
jgi:hypothetical protein